MHPPSGPHPMLRALCSAHPSFPRGKGSQAKSTPPPHAPPLLALRALPANLQEASSINESPWNALESDCSLSSGVGEQVFPAEQGSLCRGICRNSSLRAK